jgi:hypothetical protein
MRRSIVRWNTNELREFGNSREEEVNSTSDRIVLHRLLQRLLAKVVAQDEEEEATGAGVAAEAAAGIDGDARGRRIGAPPSRALLSERRSLFRPLSLVRRLLLDVVRLG